MFPGNSLQSSIQPERMAEITGAAAGDVPVEDAK